MELARERSERHIGEKVEFKKQAKARMLAETQARREARQAQRRVEAASRETSAAAGRGDAPKST